MNCQTLAELLPWLLNGTLAPDEQKAVKDHLESCETCRSELAAARLAAEVYAAHPTAQDLIDYVLERPLRGLERQTLARHLAGCPTCSEELALLRHSREESEIPPAAARPPAGRVLAGPWTARRWQAAALAASLLAFVGLAGLAWNQRQTAALHERVAAVEDAAARAGELAAENRRLAATAGEDRQEIARLEGELAAGRAAQEALERRLAEPSRGAGAAATPALIMGLQVELLTRLGTAFRSGERPGEAPTLRRAAGPAALSFEVPPEAARYPRWRLVLADEGGGRLLTAEAPAEPASDLYNLGLDPRGLPAGLLTLRLYGLGEGDAALLGEYPVRIE
jgi:hypothetical protein